jgi:hypothetical protein
LTIVVGAAGCGTGDSGLSEREVAPATGGGAFFDAAESSCVVCASSAGSLAWSAAGAILAAVVAVAPVAVDAAECAAVRAEP